ncbi:MAG: hypothetical protein Q9157_007540 [Trypethelium eluteriae]
MSSAIEPISTSEAPQDLSRNRRAQDNPDSSEETKVLEGCDEGGEKDGLDSEAPVESGFSEDSPDAKADQHGFVESHNQDTKDSQQQNAGRTDAEIITGEELRQDRGYRWKETSNDAGNLSDLLQNARVGNGEPKEYTLSPAEVSSKGVTDKSREDGQIQNDGDRQRPIRVDTAVPVGSVRTGDGPEGVVGESDQNGKSEIQSIMDQFEEGKGAPGENEIMSPRLEIAQPQTFPPRSSSLEPVKRNSIPPETSSGTGFIPLSKQSTGQSISNRSSVAFSDGQGRSSETTLLSPDLNSSPRSSMSAFKPPPPEPDPEPDLPFDFHRFLEQLRHRTADPVAKFLRSFLLEFGKKQWMVHEQVKIISDFLEFIAKKMSQCEVWRTVSDAEFDNAREGMEKLVMNRLYNQTFSPAIPAPEPAPGKGRRKNPQLQNGPGRGGQHQEDVERDEVLAQKVRIYGWVREEHLDIKPIGEKGRKFLKLAQQELLKITSYRAPRDKVICVLNCCKVIFGFLRNSKSDQSADSFVPLLIYTVLQANPDHLVSNVQYILRFRNQDKLGGEAGYYMSSLMGAVQFIENLDRTSLTVSNEEFEKNVEAAVSAIAERHSEEMKAAAPIHPPLVSEKSSLSRPEVTPRNSLEAERSSPLRRGGSLRNTTESSDNEENAAVAGLLRTIQKPLSTIGRIFSDDGASQNGQQQHLVPAQPVTTPRLSPSPQIQRNPSGDRREQQPSYDDKQGQISPAPPRMSAEDAAARQASAEAAEAQRISRAEHRDVVETLSGMFPDLDRDVISDVVRQKEGR